jgi:hypothetical protein
MNLLEDVFHTSRNWGEGNAFAVSDALNNCLSQRSRLALAERGSQAKEEGEQESLVLVGG